MNEKNMLNLDKEAFFGHLVLEKEKNETDLVMGVEYQTCTSSLTSYLNCVDVMGADSLK